MYWKDFDKSGKKTQSDMLLERLKSDGYKVMKSEFHRYDTYTGDLVMKWLKKEWDVDQETIELIMAADKQAQQKWFDELESDGYDILILDRYILSQVVYASANKMDIGWVKSLQSNMRVHDIDIVIDIPAEVSMKRKGKHNNGENDRYESDLEMLQLVRNNYIILPDKLSAPLKLTVNGNQSVEDIHEEIYSIIQDNVIHGGIDA